MKRTIHVCDRHAPEDEIRADETVIFWFGGVEYEIDLCVTHAEEYRAFEAQQQEWVSSARTRSTDVESPRPRQRVRMSNAQRLENAAIREWAPTVGIDLGQRGRIPEDLRQRYHAEVGEDARRRWTEASALAGDSSPAPVPV